MLRNTGFASAFVLVILVALSVVGCNLPARSDSLKLESSRLMLNVSKAWAKTLGERPSPLHVELGEGGSTEAIQKLLKGDIDVALTSRRISRDEIVDARSRGVKVEESCIGFLIYAIVVHPSNTVSAVTTQQVSDVFSGKLKSWDLLGGPKQPITRVYRRVRPGEYDHFFERVVKGDPTEAGTVVFDQPDEIVKKLAADPQAMGYLLTPRDTPKEGLRKVPVRRTPESTPTEATVDAALSGDYPLLRPLYLYINRASARPAGFFRDFVLGEEGREVAKKEGMVPLPQKGRGEIDASRFSEMLSW